MEAVTSTHAKVQTGYKLLEILVTSCLRLRFLRPYEVVDSSKTSNVGPIPIFNKSATT